MRTEEQLKRIQAKLHELLKRYAAVQKENSRLKDELTGAKSRLSALQESHDTLKQQVDVLKYGNGEMTGDEKREFERKINGYIKEIDRCIVMLGR